MYSPTSSLSKLTTSCTRVACQDNTHLGLKQLGRSPREIFEKKAQIVRGMRKIEEETKKRMNIAMWWVVEEGKEVMVELRLLYFVVVSSMIMKNRVEVKKNEPPLGEKVWKRKGR